MRKLFQTELTKELIDHLERKGALKRSYAEVFRETAKTPGDILFSNAVDPKEFALSVSEITEIPFVENPSPIEQKRNSFFDDDEEEFNLNLEEIFSEWKVAVKEGIAVLYPLVQHYNEENLKIISFTDFRRIVSSYILTSPTEVKKEISSDNYADALYLIFIQAAALSASDIHIDPFEKDWICSFRIDGDLKVFCSLLGKGEELIHSLFTLATISHDKSNYQPTSMRLTGEFLVRSAKNLASKRVRNFVPFLKGIDFRIETVPCGIGKKSAVIRLLDKNKTFWNLDSLGLQESIVEKLKLLAPKRGVLLITGETGSGKTTTCYALLSTLDAVRKKIVTIEDPIELQNPFWRQLQYKEGGDYELSFENLLASVLRQDPDIIFVGEVRNAQTASLLFQGANTGHSAISTLHTNSVYDTIARLADLLKEVMGEQEIRMRLASFMKGILSQRLLKRVCPHCGRWEAVDESFLLSLEPHVQSAIKQMGIKKHLVGKGCKECDYTGYKGRVLVSEFVEFTKEIAEAVLKGEITRFEFDNLIEGQGFRTILKDALYRVRLGETNLYQVVERL